MILPEDCYAPLKTKSIRLFKYLQELVQEPQDWQKHFGFDCVEINTGWIDAEPALAEVDAVYPIARLGLLRISPFTFYDWHVDAYRQACINMQINLNHPSHTLFGYQTDGHNKDVLELRYQPRTFYLFNNQIEHCVANLGGPRYVFSLYFKEEKHFEFIKADLMEANLISC
jgi:hypothetical protein